MELKKKDASVSENLFDKNIIQNEKILIYDRLWIKMSWIFGGIDQYQFCSDPDNLIFC